MIGHGARTGRSAPSRTCSPGGVYEGDGRSREPWSLSVAQMNRIHVAMARGDTADQYIRSAGIPRRGAPAVLAYWAALAQEVGSPLPAGHYWDVPAD